MSQPTLECQTCGKVLQYLSPSEAQQVARNPHDFIVDCYECLRELVGVPEKESNE